MEIEISNSIEKKLFTLAKLNNKPLYGVLELTPLCNMNCEMCYVRLSKSEMKQFGKIKTADEWISLGKQMRNAGVLFVLLTGGEPLMHPEFKRIYIELIKMGMILTINTNGTLIDEQWISFFKKYRPRRINITLYGSNELIYEKLCHYKGFEKTICTIKMLKKNGIDVKINGSMTQLNKECLNELYSISKNLEVPIHIDTYMIPSKNKNIIRLNPKEAAYLRVESYYYEMGKEEFINYAISMIEKSKEINIKEHTRYIRCYAGKCIFAINWLGQLRACITMNSPEIDINDNFIEAWEKLNKEVHAIMINEKCSTCSLFPVCNTCAANAYLEEDSYNAIPNYLCEYAIYTIEYLKEKLTKINK